MDFFRSQICPRLVLFLELNEFRPPYINILDILNIFHPIYFIKNFKKKFKKILKQYKIRFSDISWIFVIHQLILEEHTLGQFDPYIDFGREYLWSSFKIGGPEPSFLLFIKCYNSYYIIYMGHSATVRSRSGGDVWDLLRNFLYKNTCRKIHTQFF